MDAVSAFAFGMVVGGVWMLGALTIGRWFEKRRADG